MRQRSPRTNERPAWQPIALRRRMLWFAGVGLIGCLAGCATYQIGNRSLYPPDIRTVYVPMFESQSFRRNLGERLTEAVMKEIELKTPYKVVNSPNADSVLTGNIVEDTKRVMIENFLDEPRQLEARMVVQVTWTDRRGELLREGLMPVPPAAVEFNQSTKFVPEIGQSIATGQQATIQRLAEQIVNLMEAPW